MVARTEVRIGQEAFVLSPDGEVVRTIVAKLNGKGYRLLNGDDECRSHWFSFDEAVSAARNRINAQQAALRKELRVLAHKRRTLETQNYRDGVMSAPYKVVDLRDTTTLVRLRHTRVLKKVCVPETYFMPGHVAYAIITPMTRLESEDYGYRPHEHFILETEVMSVCFSPDGQTHYMFSTPFVVEEFFSSRKEATARLESYSEPGTKDPVHFVSSRKEKEELEKMIDDVPF
ncbi:hypothetical protein HY412_02140 [Candidatus Kaiserbacteria bacterium]|nr:hypothetical protein [Candidatus Kaiserbacteria bacterium]